MAGTDFGSDISTFPDLDPTFTPISGSRVLAEAIARRLSTRRGTLSEDRDYGYDLLGLLNADLDATSIAQREREIAAECEKDERIDSADVSLAFSGRAALLVTVSATTADGPFELVLAIAGVTVSILRVS